MTDMKDYSKHIFGYSTSIYSLDLNKIKELGFKYIIADLDQTLVPTMSKVPDENVLKLINELKKLNLEMIIVSNNTNKRVNAFCKNLDIRKLAMANKSNGKKVCKFLKNCNIEIDKCIFIGDQLRTDCNYVSKLKGKFIITRPLNNIDNIITHLFRKNEEKMKDYLINNNLCGINLNKEEQ